MSSRAGGARRRSVEGCEGPDRNIRYRTLEAIVRAYKARFRKRSEEELASFAAESIPDAIRRAGLARRPDGKRYDHQRRIRGDRLQQSASKLRRVKLGQARTFEELHKMVHQAIGSISGIGPLTVYDTALRIGANLSLSPRRVYLHTGTRIGARKLGLNWRANSLAMSEVPAAFHELQAHEVEDVLCIFEGHFDRLQN